MKNKSIAPENYLDKIPRHALGLNWNSDEKGLVTLEQENRGIANKIAQILIKKPKVSFIHLDEFGSFIWLAVDGEKNVYQIGKEVSGHFGEKAEPLYERLTKYFDILKNYGFVEF